MSEAVVLCWKMVYMAPVRFTPEFKQLRVMQVKTRWSGRLAGKFVDNPHNEPDLDACQTLFCKGILVTTNRKETLGQIPSTLLG